MTPARRPRRWVLLAAGALLAVAGGCALHDRAPPQAPAARAAATAPVARVVAERVTFDSIERDAATGAPVRLAGLLFRPDGAAGLRRPAVVALHGCGGMYSTAKSRRDELSLRHQAMAELLLREGYVVLFPDSFRSRGREEICTVEYRLRTITQASRRHDAQGALAYLQQRADVDPARVALLGWSHGGSAVLATLDGRHPAVAAWKSRAPDPPYFRAGVAFYPGCRDALQSSRGYAVAAPLALYVGGADDWTAPGPCIDLARRLAEAGEPVAITVYAGAYHGFDGPPGQRQRLDVPNGVHPGAGVTVASDPAAREDAYARLRVFLREQLGAPNADGGRAASAARAAD